MIPLSHRLDRTVVIRASRDTVFGFLTNTAEWAEWWGAGSTIDARPGGAMLIRHSNGVEASGEVLDIRAPERIVFTYGYVSRKPSPPGSSRVTIRLDSHPHGTLLQLTHEFADAESRDEHVQGWRFQFSLFANLVANTVNAAATRQVDRWFATWSEPVAATRDASLAAIGSADMRFLDKFSTIEGRDEVKAHLAAVHRFMPGMRLERRGEIRHCQWHVLADWVVIGSSGQEQSGGTSLFELDADGRIAKVTGFWRG
jgi:uncharacterized protein YndB with AHSA1/START domain